MLGPLRTTTISWSKKRWSLQLNGITDGQLQAALDKFKAALTPEQKQDLQKIKTVPDAATVIAFPTYIANEHAKRRSRYVETRLLTVLQSFQQFLTVVDTFVSSNPATSALV